MNIMDVGMYFEMIISILIGLVLVVLFLVFLYMIYGKEEQSRPLPTSFLKYLKRYFWIYQSHSIYSLPTGIILNNKFFL